MIYIQFYTCIEYQKLIYMGETFYMRTHNMYFCGKIFYWYNSLYNIVDAHLIKILII